MNPKQNDGTLFFAFILLIGLIALTRFTNLKPHWGSLEMRPVSSITVSGQAKKDQVNQIASFTAGVESIEATKEEALNKANEAMNQLISKVKQFGVKEEDIKTEQTTVYQETEYVTEPQPMELQAVEGSTGVSSMMYPPRPSTKPQKGSWRANNSVSIKLRDAKQAETLLAILNESGANYVYGPNFSVDNAETLGDELLSAAVANAKQKANDIANANNQKVGKIISVTEGGSAYPMYGAYDSVMPMSAGMGKSISNAELEPGSSSTSKTVTVTFELN
jgi:uncharacterized protein YggE